MQINSLQAISGRIVKEDSSFINIADIIAMAIDPMNGVFIVDEEQHAIHEGNAYSYSTHGTINAGASLTLLGRIGNKQVHFDGMNVDFQSGGVLLEFLEAPTITNVGTAQTVRRKNRATVKDNVLDVYLGATTTGGTIVFDSLPPIVSGQGNKTESASSGVVKGWVLKANTDYIMKFTNTNAVSVTFDANFGWHESSVILA